MEISGLNLGVVHNFTQKAFTTDDIGNIRPGKIEGIKRSSSLHNLRGHSYMVPASCLMKSTKYWTCVARTPAPHGGFLYISTPTNEYLSKLSPEGRLRYSSEYAEEMLKDLFPADQALTSDLFPLMAAVDGAGQTALRQQYKLLKLASKKENEEMNFLSSLGEEIEQVEQVQFSHDSNMQPIFEQLGFKVVIIDNRVYQIAPDHEALMRSWEQYALQDSNLPPKITIVGIQEDTTDDLNFVSLWMVSDGILSLRKEFNHDSFFHIMALIQLIHACNYTEVKREFVAKIKPYYDRVIKIKKLEEKKFNLPGWEDPDRAIKIMGATLGAIVDILTSYNSPWEARIHLQQGPEKFFDATMETLWLPYFQGRFENFDPAEVKKIWESSRIIEQVYTLRE
jgi:hypothetical protein